LLPRSRMFQYWQVVAYCDLVVVDSYRLFE